MNFNKVDKKIINELSEVEEDYKKEVTSLIEDTSTD